jgi:hypothetical protein
MYSTAVHENVSLDFPNDICHVPRKCYLPTNYVSLLLKAVNWVYNVVLLNIFKCLATCVVSSES